MLSKSSFKLQPLPRIVFGVDSSAGLAAHVRACGCEQALIVTDKGLVDAGLIAPLREQLEADNIKTLLFDGVEPNPTDRNVAEGAELLRQLKDPAIVAIGGGSSMDAAKAIGLLGPNGGTVNDYPFGCKPANPGRPIVAVPTTSGTGSETNMFSLITDTTQGRKIYVGHPSIQPKVAVLDPALTVGLPPYPTATCGVDVLTHAVEAVTSRQANPFADGVALEAIRMAYKWLPKAHKDGSDLEARSQMLLASSMAAMAFNVTGLGACHGCGHPISARFHTAHGQTLATMLPHVMAFNFEICSARYARIAEAMGVSQAGGSDAVNARAAVEGITTLCASLGLARTLRELGAGEEHLSTLIEDAQADMTMRTNARKVTAEDTRALYVAAMG